MIGAQQSWCSLNPSTTVPSSHVRLTWSPENHGRLCAWNRAFGCILCVFCSDWSVRRLDVCICTDSSEKCFALKDVVNLLRSGTCLGTDRDVPDPFVPDCARSGLSLQKKTRCCVLGEKVAWTSRRCHCNFLILCRGNWWLTVVSFTWTT